MNRFAAVVLCLIGVSAGNAQAQSSSIEPLHVAAGTVLTFHLQTRLHPVAGDSLNALPEGTALHVKMLDAIDSTVNGDGSEFRGSIVAPLSAGDEIVVPSGAPVRGLLALLRSRNHPEGFRYELLVTGITEHGKSYALTASLDSSLFDANAPSAATKSAPKLNLPVAPVAASTPATKLP